MANFDVRVLEPGTIVETVTAHLVGSIDERLDHASICNVALSGGTTPKAVYEALGRNTTTEWSRVVFWEVDERAVPEESPRSNAQMIRKALTPLLDQGAKFYPFFGEGDLDAAAEGYADLLEGALVGAPPRFDVVLLGIGDDGHTASLFPGDGTIALSDEPMTRAVPAVPAQGREARLTLSATTILAARELLLLATGASKAPALARLFADEGREEETPSRLLRRARNPVVVYLDVAAGGRE